LGMLFSPCVLLFGRCCRDCSSDNRSRQLSGPRHSGMQKGKGLAVFFPSPLVGYGMPESDSLEFMDVIQGLSTCLGRRAYDVFWRCSGC
jgi:hypothetical protein